ncbi:MAG: diguanylate cyclase [Lachnospiraceae bacterium]|nr:diguanylate cyclase [Lachnospiraceae bacterium]
MKCILVVDDSTTNLKFVENVLMDEYKLALVKSGQLALKYLSKNPVDLVLLDLHMPEMDGFETFEKIRQLEMNQDVPVVFLTADVDVDSEIKGLKMGAKDFIRKPFVPEVMLNRIRSILQLEELNKSLEHKVEEKTAQIERLSFEIIATIASMIEAKDSYTKGHSVRVAEYSALVAKALGWQEEEVKNIKYIALLHDIGKVGIPDNVLNKPGKLTEIEFNIIKSHTTIGGDILKDIETIAGVDEGAKYHHERYDGKGYPCGISGKEIPTVARIICIADAYDAMNSKRIYRNNLSKDVIRKELIAGRGTQFDPDFLDIFVQLLDDGKLQLNIEEKGQEKTISGESSMLLSQIIKNIEEESQKNEEYDYLTGLLNRKIGENKIVQAMKEQPGCLAFVDLDNLKRTNDTMGHLAGDYALLNVGEVLSEYKNNAIIARVGGDEFLYYMIGANKEEATDIIEGIIRSFEGRKENNAYLSVSSLSIGLCISTPKDSYGDVLQKADKALYHMKQSGKAGYYFYTNMLNGSGHKSSIDLDRLVNNLEKQGAYTGSLSVEYREFAKIYDFIRHLVERYDHNMQLIMFTLEPVKEEKFDIDEQENAMNCMENAIKASLRTVDVSTRFSSKQFLVVLLNAQKEDIDMITNRIFDKFYKTYDSKLIEMNYDIADLLKINQMKTEK